ncbi:hypothetical protein M3O96_05880 [Aquiflexum sp. TKW24L]|uniref:hypothetical protein n=1 Tax=Aquiflexum sp. TKW24L TaxID=2942212 RepID=UPI0020C06BD2|nr:hypothetical protein [Aquiflexum sp. TKW24L]MCL6258608.1 hypothetical protein [Aquiflexum sp. TKW24L]
MKKIFSIPASPEGSCSKRTFKNSTSSHSENKALHYKIVLPIFIIAFLFSISDSFSQEKEDVSKLFRSEEVLDLKLGFSFKDIKKSDKEQAVSQEWLYYKDKTGEWDSLKIDLFARGNFRKDHCFFTPLKIKIAKKDREGSIFKGNKTLKLVMPCQNNKMAADLTLKEYMIYKMYEEVTPYHFHTRLVNITLTDRGGKQEKSFEIKAFLIEDDSEIADRFEATMKKEMEINPFRFMDTVTIRQEFFQFMIANTDWSTTAQHNVAVMQLPNKSYIPLCYDFDMAGFVNAPYAVVNPLIPINSVTERYYRGLCREEGLFQNTREHYLSIENNIWNAYGKVSPMLSPNEQETTKKFLTAYFDILKNDKKFRDNIFSNCRK